MFNRKMYRLRITKKQNLQLDTGYEIHRGKVSQNFNQPIIQGNSKQLPVLVKCHTLEKILRQSFLLQNVIQSLVFKL